MKIRILHTADLHLGAPLKNFGEMAQERRRDILRTFDRIINLAIKREVDFLLVAGDLFDSNRVDSETVGRVQQGFDRLAGRGIRVVLIPGTHDNLVSAESVYNRHSFEGVHIFRDPLVTEPHGVEIRGQNVYFYGFAHRTDSSIGALDSMGRRQTEGIHVGLLHGSLVGNPEWDMRRKDVPFGMADLAALGLDYMALGHYHNHACLAENGRVLACYPGSPEGKKFGENGERYVLLLEVGEGDVLVEKVAVQHRILDEFSLDASLFTEPGGLEGELTRRASPDLIARVRLYGTVEDPLDISNLLGRLQGKYAWLELLDETDIYDSGHVKRMEREDSIRGLFIRKLQQRFARAESAEEQELCRDALKIVMGRFMKGGGY